MTKDAVPKAHQEAVDAHFDSLPKAEQLKARQAGFKPYRELRETEDHVFPLNPGQADYRLMTERGQDIDLSRKESFTREEVLGIISVLLDSVGSRRNAYLRGQTEVIRLGLGIGSKTTMRGVARLLGLKAVSSVHERVACFRRRFEQARALHMGAKGGPKESFYRG